MRPRVTVDAMLGVDLPFVVDIERESQLEPWSRSAFVEELANSRSVCYVARRSSGGFKEARTAPRRLRRLPGVSVLKQETGPFCGSPRWSSNLSLFGSVQRVTHRTPGIRARWNTSVRHGSTTRPPGVMGYICFWVVADELHILNVAVHRAYRRRGVGRVLLLRAIREGRIRGLKKALLEVRSSNTDARRFYESLGFQAVGERPGYYGRNGEAAVLMDLILEASANGCS